MPLGAKFHLLCICHTQYIHVCMLCVQAVTTPSMAVSHIMLEAYKKYLLVALILHGKVSSAYLISCALYHIAFITCA